MNNKLEIDWRCTPLAETVEVLDRERVPVNQKERDRRTAGKPTDDLFPYYGATGQVGWIDDFIFEGEMILLGEDGAPFLDPRKPKAYLVSGRYWVNNHAHILRAREGYDQRFLCYQLNSLDYRQFVSGTTRLKLTQADLRRMVLAFPPTRSDQILVADKLDELFSDLEKGEEHLARAEALLTRYRQSVLNAAVTGELTRDWRKAHGGKGETGEDLLARILTARREAWEEQELERLKAKGKPPRDDRWKARYKEPVPPNTDSLPPLPEGWVWACVGQLGSVSGGITKHGKRSLLPDQHPYLRVANVYADELRLDDVALIGVRPEELERALLRKDDLLIVEGNGSLEQIGRAALWDGAVPGCVHQNHIIKVRFDSSDLARFVLAWMLSPAGRRYVERVASSTSGLHTLSISKIAALPVPVPPANELSQTLLACFESLESFYELRAAAETAQSRTSALGQVVLSAAFGGRLSAQASGKSMEAAE